MEPAFVIASLALVVLTMRLAIDGAATTVRILRNMSWSVPGFMARRVGCVAAVVTIGSLVRFPSVSAATPPPYIRIAPQPPGSIGPPSEQSHEVASDGRASVGAASRSYTVESGDCLWRIARKALAEGGRTPEGASISDYWREIYRANRALIGPNPNLIHPGQILILPEV